MISCLIYEFCLTNYSWTFLYVSSVYSYHVLIIMGFLLSRELLGYLLPGEENVHNTPHIRWWFAMRLVGWVPFSHLQCPLGPLHSWGNLFWEFKITPRKIHWHVIDLWFFQKITLGTPWSPFFLVKTNVHIYNNNWPQCPNLFF